MVNIIMLQKHNATKNINSLTSYLEPSPPSQMAASPDSLSTRSLRLDVTPVTLLSLPETVPSPECSTMTISTVASVTDGVARDDASPV